MPSKKPRNYPKYTSLFQIQVSNPTIPSLVLLDVSTVLPSVVARWAVLANMESRLAVLGVKDTITLCRCATNLGGGLPHHLGPMRGYRAVGVVLANLVRPTVQAVRDGPQASGSGVEVLTVCTDSASRVLELAAVSPVLGSVRESVAPYERLGVVSSTDGVVAVQVGGLVGSRGSTGLELLIDGASKSTGREGENSGEDGDEAGHDRRCGKGSEALDTPRAIASPLSMYMDRSWILWTPATRALNGMNIAAGIPLLCMWFNTFSVVEGFPWTHVKHGNKQRMNGRKSFETVSFGWRLRESNQLNDGAGLCPTRLPSSRRA